MRPLGVLTVAAVSAWLGIMAFFSLVTAPELFRTLPRETAGAAAAAALPGYYAAGIALCGLALAGFALRLARGAARLATAAGAALTTVMLGLVLWSLLVVLPATEAARVARDGTRFAALHRRAVSLNLVTMLCAVLVLGLEVVSPRGDRSTTRRAA